MTACISISMVLILIGTVVFFATMADSISRQVKENFMVEVLLEDSLTSLQTYQLQQDIEAMPYTRRVDYTSKDRASRLQAEELDINPEEFLGYSPIPASFELSLKAEYANPDSLDAYMPNLFKASGVTDVVYPNDLMGKINEYIRTASIILLAIALLLGTVSIALINSTLRLSIAQRRHTIQTMKLVGARWSFIRRPFLVQAVVLGLVAAGIAMCVLGSGIIALRNLDEEVATLISSVVVGATLVSVLVSGVLLTLICAYFSVNKHLTMSRDEAYLY